MKPTGDIIDAELFDFSDPATVRRYQSDAARRKGLWRVTLTPGRAGTTDPQRGYYFGVIVRFFADYVREQDPTLTLSEANDTAHLEIKRHCLPEPVVDANGRIVAERVGSVRKIDVARMSKLIDDAIHWLGSEWNITVPPPSHEERYGTVDQASAA